MFNHLPGPDTEQLSWETDPGVKKWEKKKDLPMGKLTSIYNSYETRTQVFGKLES